MASERLVKIENLSCLIAVLLIAGVTHADIATFEDLGLSEESYWNGSDESGGFYSGGAHFNNLYTPDWGSWEGFAYSNITDTAMTGLDAQYNAITGTGQGGSANYAIAYVGWSSAPTITLRKEGVVDGLYVTNNNYTYYSMLDGSAFSKKFGGDNGDDPDWFMLTVTGKDAEGVVTGNVDFYLADYRFADNSADYIVNTWEYIDLTSLGVVKNLEFALSSSDVGDWGMNTPAYFAIDTLVDTPESVPAMPYIEPGINGFVSPENFGRHASPEDPNAIINPIFRGWATEVVSYDQKPDVDPMWQDTSKALGPVTGIGSEDIFSLGDLSIEQISEGVTPGQITLAFDEVIRNGKGYDIVVFENGMLTQPETDESYATGEMFAEFAYVEVSSNGEDFVRFPSVSLAEGPVGLFDTIEISKIHNLAGKHPNSYGICTGTPFDLQEIANDPKVVSGLVDINDIRYVRIVDIPGTGDFYDEAVMHIDPNTWPAFDSYSENHPIYDPWNTTLVPLHPSGGFDLEAVGVLNEQKYSADIDLNGIVDSHDFELLASAWQSHFGEPDYIPRCDLAEPKDLVIDMLDLSVFLSQWQQKEDWHN